MRVSGLPIRVLARFYRWRLRRYWFQEALAGGGIAVGVALVFAVLVANTSIEGSAEQMVRGIVGEATLQLAARDEGFDEELLERARALEGVREAAPLFNSRVVIEGPAGRRTVSLLGLSPSLARLRGELALNLDATGLGIAEGLTLPSGVAESIGAKPKDSVTAYIDGRAERLEVAAVLGPKIIGPLSLTPGVAARLDVAQELAGTKGRLKQVLVAPEPGSEALVRRGLERIAGDRVAVAPADAEVRALRRAAAPNDQSTGLFAAIGVLVGVMFAVSASLLTVPERRAFVAELRLDGFDRRQVLTLIGFEALVLGLGGSVVGLLLGDLLVRVYLGEVPEYLALAFAIGDQRVIEPSSVATACIAGIAAAALASVVPALDLFSRKPIDAPLMAKGEAGGAIGFRTKRRLSLLAAGLTSLTAVGVLLVPAATLMGVLLLGVGMLFMLPTFFAGALRLLARYSTRNWPPAGRLGKARGASGPVALLGLRSSPIRSVSLAAIAALAVYGSVAVEGSRRDLIRGGDQSVAELMGPADVWVASPGDVALAESFRATGALARIERAPGVADVRPYHGRLVDMGDRRLWLIARSPGDRPLVPASQVVEGNVAEATRRVARGGWAAISREVAESEGVGVGESFSLPSPAGPLRLRVAALMTNLTWPPGAVVMNGADYRRGWGAERQAAFEVDLAPGVAPIAGKRAVERALGAGTALRVQTRAERIAERRRIGREGVERLTQISALLLIAAGLAFGLTLAGVLWQRRPELAELKLDGFRPRKLWSALMLEALVVVSVGCAAGAAFGLSGHYLATRWLESVSGFPAPFSAWDVPALGAIGLVVAIALLVTALPGYLVARVPERVAFQE